MSRSTAVLDLVHDVCKNTQFLGLCDDAHPSVPGHEVDA